MVEQYDADVIVIGGGPVGATALALLSRSGMSAIGVEKEDSVWPTARAVHFDGETFRLLQTLGLTDQFAEVTRPMADFEIQNEAEEVLISLPTGQFGTQAWHENITFYQPDIERLLRDAIATSNTVELRSGVEAVSVENLDGGGVEVDVRSIDGGTSTLRARWVIGADGGRSTVRKILSIDADRFGEDAEWLVVDGHLVDSPGYDADMIFLGRHSRPALWVRLPGTRVRMEFKLVEGDDRDELVTSSAIERISRGVLPAAHFTPSRQVIYTFRGRIAQTWRVGDVFLAGDAAHQAPPLFGQGLCAGMRDVANLTWKLDFVRRGLAGAELLDTYESERKPHAQFWVEQAVQAAGFVQTTDPEVAVQRDEFLRANPSAAAPVVPALGPGLHSGSDDKVAGYLSIQPQLETGERLDDVVGVRFLIASTPELFASLSVETRVRIEAGSDIVAISEGHGVDQLLDATGVGAVVVRPDRYMLGGANDSKALEDLINAIPDIATNKEISS